MNTLWIITTLRAVALLFDLQNRAEGGVLAKLADALEAGNNVDAHMRRVAQALKDGGSVRTLEEIGAELAFEEERLARAAAGAGSGAPGGGG